MRNLLLFATLLLLTHTASSQTTSAYFMEGTTLRSSLNPAFAPQRGYVNIPTLGGIELSTSGNLSLDRILFPHDGKLVTLLDSSVSATEALSGLHPQNRFGVDSRVNLIGFGAYTHNRYDFWSFELNLRSSADLNLPYSLFDFFKNGRSTQVRGIELSAQSYLEAAFCYSFPVIEERLYLGVRGKMLFGVARASLYYSRFDASLEEDSWRVDAAGTLDITAAGTEIRNDSSSETYKPGDLHFRPTQPAGYGFAVDLGATYDILPELHASLAVTDLGFIGWSKRHNVTGLSEKELEFTGVEVDQSGTTTQPDFDLDVLEFTPQEAHAQSKMLNARVNAGIGYDLWNRRIGIGVLYSATFRPYRTLHELTGSLNFTPIYWCTLTGSYSVIDNQAHAVGLALNLCPRWIHFFVATDLLTTRHTPQWVPIRQNQIQLSLGVGVPIGRYGYRTERAANARRY